MPGHVFLSYSRQDRSFVEKLSKEIAGAGLPVWFDHELAAGEQWSDVLERKIEGCAVFVVVMSTASATSTWVKREVRLAQDLGKPVVPLLLSGRVWFVVNDLHYVDVTDGRVPPGSFLRRLTTLGAADTPEAATRPVMSSRGIGEQSVAATASAVPVPRESATPGRRQMSVSSFTKAKAHGGAVSRVAWAPDSPRFVTTGVDGTCQFWDAGSGRVSRVTQVPHARGGSLAVWRNENFVITGSGDGLRWWNPETGKEVSQSLGHGRVTALDGMTGYQGNQELVAAGTATGRVLVVRMGRVEELELVPRPHRNSSSRRDSTPVTRRRVVAVAVGRNRALTGTRTPLVGVVDRAEDGASAVTVWPGSAESSTALLEGGIGEPPQQVAWSVAGVLAVANPARHPGAKVPAVEVWPSGDVQDKQVIPLAGTQSGSAARAVSVAWAPDGRHLAVGMTDGRVHICDGQQSVVVRSLSAGSTGLVAVFWAAAGDVLATVAEGGRRRAVWHALEGALMAELEPSVSALAWAPQGTVLAMGNADGDVRLTPFAG